MNRQTEDDTPIAASLIAALHDNPFYRAITAALPSDDQDVALGRYFQYALQEGRQYGIVVQSEDGRSGAAIWAAPQEPATTRETAQAKHEYLRALLGRAGWAAYASMVTFMERVATDVIPHQAWYLSILGVAPEAQSKGLGERLLRPTLAKLDTEQRVCYVETFNPRSVPFYERRGFVSVVLATEPYTRCPYWLMLRQPQVERVVRHGD